MSKIPETENLEDRCLFKPIAIQHFFNEVYGLLSTGDREKDIQGSFGYFEIGCLPYCDGYKDCTHKITSNYKKGMMGERVR